MKNYLIFFGSSFGFKFYLFDENGIVENPDTVIKDFSLADDQIFTTDSELNKEILSKTSFQHDGKSYSLVKLYSLAQAIDNSRITGCTYGVGILSEVNVLLSNVNINILKAAKDNFGRLSLDGKKFNKPDFKGDVHKIWAALVNHRDGNYLVKIQNNQPVRLSGNNLYKGFVVSNLYSEPESIEIQGYLGNTNYFSEDLPHLLRAQKKWGDKLFPVYIKKHNQYQIYTEESRVVPSKHRGDNFNKDFQIEIIGLQKQFNEEKIKNKLVLKKAELFKKLSIIFGVFSGIFLISTGVLFYQKSINVSENNKAEKKIETNEVLPVNIDSIFSVQIKQVLSDSLQNKAIGDLLINLGKIKKLRGKDSKEAKRIIKAIHRDAAKLKMDSIHTLDLYR